MLDGIRQVALEMYIGIIPYIKSYNHCSDWFSGCNIILWSKGALKSRPDPKSMVTGTSLVTFIGMTLLSMFVFIDLASSVMARDLFPKLATKLSYCNDASVSY
jgi:hypothetical protein